MSAPTDARAGRRASLDILFEGQRTLTGLDGDVTLATLEDWLLRAREVVGAGELFDRLRRHAGSPHHAEPIELNRDEARVLVAVSNGRATSSSGRCSPVRA